MQCPLLYRFRVIDKLPEAPSAAASRGTLVHAVLERVFDVEAPQRTLEHARSLVPGEWEAMVRAESELEALAGTSPQELERWFEDAEKLVEKWFTMEDPQRLEPAEREAYVEASLDDGLTIRGYIDRLDIAPGGEIRVVDYKTGRSPSELFEAKALFQMKFYALVVWRSRGVMPLMLQLVYLGNGQFLRYQPDEADLLALERKLEARRAAIARAVETGDWRPRRSRLCSWCNHKALCPEWGGTPPPLPTTAAQASTQTSTPAPTPTPTPTPTETQTQTQTQSGSDDDDA